MADSKYIEFKQALMLRGLDDDQADALVVDFGDAILTWHDGHYPIINFYCQYDDWQEDQRENKYLSGSWLFSVIREGWRPPLSFKTNRKIK